MDKAGAPSKSSRSGPRRSVNRVRTGCTTCKIRRIKCDEAKPDCKRCASSGRRCDGYNVPKQLLFEICTDPVERWSFHYFHARTAKHMVSFQEFHLWDRLVLQASHSEDVVRRMVVAIGAYHECVDTSNWQRSVELFRYANTQYNRALSRLRQRAFLMTPEDVLLGCVLFTFFENVRGDMDAALKHLYAANSILRHEFRRRPCIPADSTFLETILSPVLAQLNISATTSTPVVSDSESAIVLPEVFESLNEANILFYRTVQAISELLDNALDANELSAITSLTRGLLSQWWAALVQYRTSPACSGPPEPFFSLGLLHLDLLHLGSRIRLECALRPLCSTYDMYHAELKHMTSISLKMIKILQALAQDDQEIKCHLGFTPTYVSSLGYVVARCRNPLIRREAITVLRSFPKTEAGWDSFLVADITEFITKLEESVTFEPVESSADVPTSARVQLMSAGCYRIDHSTKNIKLIHDFANSDLVRMRLLRHTQEGGPYFETRWLDRRRRQTVFHEHEQPNKRSSATTDPAGHQPGAVPLPTYSPMHPPSTPPSMVKAANPLTLFPEDIPGIFPQLQKLPSKLENSHPSSPDPVLALKRTSLNHIYVPSIDDSECLHRWSARYAKIGITAAEGRRIGAVASTVCGLEWMPNGYVSDGRRIYDQCEDAAAAMLQEDGGVPHVAVAGRGRNPEEPMDGAGNTSSIVSRLGASRDPSILGGVTTLQNAS